MFRDMKAVILKVIELSKKRKKSNNNSIIKNESYSEFDKKLDNYLDKLSYEEIQALQTIMYIGRDNSYNDKNMTREQIYTEQFKVLSWTEKNIEINQMTSKRNLEEYLTIGMKCLNI